ncbi:MAG: DUF397 domain-containing protein [Patescibacteria group bacterium]
MPTSFRDEDFKTARGCPKPYWLFFCVSVAITSDKVGVRDTKDPSKTTLTFTHDEWTAFIDGVKKGEFDLKHEQVDVDTHMPVAHRFIGPTRCLCGATIPSGEDICPVGQVQI